MITVSELRDKLEKLACMDPDALVFVSAGEDSARVLYVRTRPINLGACVERCVALEVGEIPKNEDDDDCAECSRLRDIIANAVSDLENA